MVYLAIYLLTCLAFTPIINKSFDNISEYGLGRLLLITVLWPLCYLFIFGYIVYNKTLDFFEDYNDRS